MKKINKICICCPAGCHLEIIDDENNIRISGNKCPRGKNYAEQELHDPRRVVTAAVTLDCAQRICVPVKSNVPVPKALIAPLLKQLSRMRVKAPVKVGDVVIHDFNGSKIDIICTGEFK